MYFIRIKRKGVEQTGERYALAENENDQKNWSLVKGEYFDHQCDTKNIKTEFYSHFHVDVSMEPSL